MQPGITQLILPNVPLKDFFEQAAAAGYEVVEVCLRNKGELTPQTTPQQCKDIVALAENAGVRIVSMCHSHVTGNILEGGDALEQSVQQTRTGLEIAAALGVNNTLHTLGRITPSVPYEDSYANAISALRSLAEDCRRLNVAIACEQIWNGFAFSPLEWRRLLDEVGSEHIGFYFDPGNMAVFHPPHHWVNLLKPHLKMVHMKDWKGSARLGEWPALLQGKVDFPVLMKSLRDAGYDGPLISEVAPDIAPIKDTALAIRTIMAM